MYVSVKGVDGLESPRTAVKYDTEVSAAPVAKTIAVENNKKGAEDTIKVTDLTEGDIVKVYNVAKDGEVKATSEAVAEGGKEATIEVKDLLESTGGTVYVTVTKSNKDESSRTAVKYATEVSEALKANNIVVLNNDGEDDIVRVTGLATGDVVNVYDAVTEGKKLGTETVGDKKTAVNVKIKQLGEQAGKVYVTVTKNNKLESVRTAKDYIAE
nr:IMP dehydrogenase [Bacillus mycoides]